MDSLEGEPGPRAYFILLDSLSSTLTQSEYTTLAIAILAIVILLIVSAAISGSENAFFSLSKADIDDLEDRETTSGRAAVKLLERPKYLLATILITNNFVNIAIILASSYVTSILTQFMDNEALIFFLQVVVVTFVIVMVGEVLPKVYAVHNNLKVVHFMARPLLVLSKILSPAVFLLVKSTSILDKRISRKGHQVSIDELNHAIDITSDEETPQEEKSILKGIVNFGNITVKQIMKGRLDVVAFDRSISFTELLRDIKKWGYSRVPIYDESFDKVAGVIYIKDLLPFLHKDKSYNWQWLVKPPYFVPESKKIDDLLAEFQHKRVHLAIVVDEYGGTSGIVTMEDIMEEVFGEIRDEFDEDELYYSKLDDYTYVFEAKMLLHDICRLMDIDSDTFDEVKGEADTLGGLILELMGKLPRRGQKVSFEHFTFTVESADKRRIKRVKLIVDKTTETTEEID